MLTSRLRSLAHLILLVLAYPALAHDDDPKVLSLQRPYRGPGFRSAAAIGSGAGTVTLPGISFPADGVQLLSWLPLNQIGGGSSANDCWGYVSPSGREYAIIGTSENTVFVEVTNPGNPQVVSIMPGPTSLWRDTKVYQDHAYSVTEAGSGIQVFDLSLIDSGTVTLSGTINDVGTSATHNVAIDEVSGFLYRCGGASNGLRIYSLANPDNPTFVGQWNTKYVHDVQVVTYTSGPLAGKQIAYCCAGFNGGFDQTSLTIVDVTDKSNMVIMDTVFYPDPAFSHQGWLSEDRSYFYLGDELDENGILTTRTHVIDVSDPNNAFFVTFFTNGNQAIGHNLYTKGDLIFEANYRSGLRVFDTSVSQTAPVEVAMFDTYPDDDQDEFNGLWSCYPYLPSGIVLGSDREKGLFVWWVGDALVAFGFPNGIPDSVDPGGESIPVQISEAFPGSLQAGSEKLFFDAGPGFVEVPLTNFGGGFYEADIPALPCGTQFDWYLSAESSNGITWTSPGGAPTATYTSYAAQGVVVTASYDMEIAAGWSAGAPGDDATTGVWQRVDPVGTAAQPEDDHTDPGTFCWVTGQGAVGGALGANDVDGGRTTLVSETLDLSLMNSPIISYWRWYSNDQGGAPNADVFEVDLSNDGGGTWHAVEVVGPSGPGTSGGWTKHSFSVADIAPPTAQVVVRFVASDLGGGSIVEAAIDDFEITDVLCATCGVTRTCTAKLNSAGCLPAIDRTGTPSLSGPDDFFVTATDVVGGQFGFLLWSLGPNDLPFFGGTLCVAPPLTRTAVQYTGGNSSGNDCSGAFSYHFTQSYLASAGLSSGDEIHVQYWYRDPYLFDLVGLTDALTVLLCP